MNGWHLHAGARAYRAYGEDEAPPEPEPSQVLKLLQVFAWPQLVYLCLHLSDLACIAQKGHEPRLIVMVAEVQSSYTTTASSRREKLMLWTERESARCSSMPCTVNMLCSKACYIASLAATVHDPPQCRPVPRHAICFAAEGCGRGRGSAPFVSDWHLDASCTGYLALHDTVGAAMHEKSVWQSQWICIIAQPFCCHCTAAVLV